MQRPFQHGMSLQQSASVLQIWPYSTQVVVPPSGTPASVREGGGCGTPQIPCVEPTGRMQVPPQQSAVVVQGPAVGTQGGGATPPSTTGPELQQCRTPLASGTQGARLQQSMAEEQMPPVGMQVVPKPLHRGTPRKSSGKAAPRLRRR